MGDDWPRGGGGFDGGGLGDGQGFDGGGDFGGASGFGNGGFGADDGFGGQGSEGFGGEGFGSQGADAFGGGVGDEGYPPGTGEEVEHYDKKKKKKDKKHKRSSFVEEDPAHDPYAVDPAGDPGHGGAGDLEEVPRDDFGLGLPGAGALPSSALDAALERERAAGAHGDLGFYSASPGGAEVRRGFSFSLQDMAEDFSAHRHAGATYKAQAAGPAARGARQKWDPLAEISRHWDERPGEVSAIPPSTRTAASRSLPTGRPALAPPPASGLAGMPPLHDYPPPATIDEELERREERAQALRARISQLESDLSRESGAAGGDAQAEGPVRVVVPHPLDGEKMGLTIEQMTVKDFNDARALQFGWAKGDRILQVNGFPVTNMGELSKEISKAMSSYKVARRPLIFEVWRQPGAGQASASTAKRPTRPNRRREACCGDDDSAPQAAPQAPAGHGKPAALVAAAPPASSRFSQPVSPAGAVPPASAPVVQHFAPQHLAHAAVLPQSAPMQVVYQLQPGAYPMAAHGAYGLPTAIAQSPLRPQVFQMAAPTVHHVGAPLGASTVVAPQVYYA